MPTDEGPEVVASEGAITVEKRLRPDEFDHPAFELRIDSAADEPRRIRVEEPVPDGSNQDEIAFHPDFGAEYWSIEDDRLVYERVLGTAETVRTSYGVAGLDPDQMDDPLSQPAIDTETIDDIAAARADLREEFHTSGDERVRDLISGEREAITPTDNSPATDIESPPPSSDPSPTADAAPDDTGVDAAATDESPSEPDVDTGPSPQPPDEAPADIAGALAAQARAGEIDEADRAALREVLGPEEGAIEARIERLEGQMSEVAAYREALKEFLDEHGTGEQLIAELETRMDDLEDRSRSMATEIDELNEEMESVRSHQDAVRDLQSTIHDLETSIEELSGTVTEIEQFRQRFRQVFERVDE